MITLRAAWDRTRRLARHDPFALVRSVLLDPQGGLRSGWKAACFVMLAFMCHFLIASPFLMYFGANPARFAGRLQLVPLTVNQLCGWLGALAATALFVSLEHRSLGSVGLRPTRRWLLQLSLGSLAGVLLMVGTALVILLWGGFHWSVNAEGSLWMVGGGIIYFVAVALHEETVYRGYPFQSLLGGAGPLVAVFIGSCVFAFMHSKNPGLSGLTRWLALLNIALAGVLLSVCYIRTRSLALPVGIHIGWNWAQGNLLGFPVSGNAQTHAFLQPVYHERGAWLSGGAFGLEGSVVCTLVLSLGILGLLLWKPRSAPGKAMVDPLNEGSSAGNAVQA